MGSHPMTWSAASQMEARLWGGRVAQKLFSPHSPSPYWEFGYPEHVVCIEKGPFSQVTKYSVLRRVTLKISV